MFFIMLRSKYSNLMPVLPQACYSKLSESLMSKWNVDYARVDGYFRNHIPKIPLQTIIHGCGCVGDYSNKLIMLVQRTMKKYLPSCRFVQVSFCGILHPEYFVAQFDICCAALLNLDNSVHVC